MTTPDIPAPDDDRAEVSEFVFDALYGDFLAEAFPAPEVSDTHNDHVKETP